VKVLPTPPTPNSSRAGPVERTTTSRSSNAPKPCRKVVIASAPGRRENQQQQQQLAGQVRSSPTFTIVSPVTVIAK